MRERLAAGLFHEDNRFSKRSFVDAEAIDATGWPPTVPAMQTIVDGANDTWDGGSTALACVLDATDTRKTTLADAPANTRRYERFANLTIIGQRNRGYLSKLSTATPNQNPDPCFRSPVPILESHDVVPLLRESFACSTGKAYYCSHNEGIEA